MNSFQNGQSEISSNILPHLEINRYGQTYAVKGQIVSVLGFVGHTVSVAATQLCSCSMKAAIDKT